MSARALAVGVLSAAAVFTAAGCAGDDSGAAGGATAGPTLTDVRPRAATIGSAAGEAPISAFAGYAAAQAITYWRSVFARSGLPYRRPSLNVLERVGGDGCGTDFDPDARPFVLCAAAGGGTRITLGGSGLDDLRSSNGAAAVVLLAGLAVALDADDQRGAISAGGVRPASDARASAASCLTGAWIRNLGDRKLLEAGRDIDVLDAADKGAGAAIGPDGLADGFAGGVSACPGGAPAAAGGTGASNDAAP